RLFTFCSTVSKRVERDLAAYCSTRGSRADITATSLDGLYRSPPQGTTKRRVLRWRATSAAFFCPRWRRIKASTLGAGPRRRTALGTALAFIYRRDRKSTRLNSSHT